MNDKDLAIVETARERRERLAAALIHGGLDSRRRLSALHKRVLIGIVVGAVAVAVCAGVSFVSKFMADRQAQNEANAVSAQPYEVPQIVKGGITQ
ncbi:hypothetical protein [Demequina muriae]|uniref:Uncharacterized protein n=1 Tax=Demequina muriae TaxID=3051664 RepID=A0ABT8GFQ7_9MICO|nr:hypothetical protein [Demequina sp. EGI L300058]MDN4480269.1 hypothetical protein [Demequina sp. EGI L300058]